MKRLFASLAFAASTAVATPVLSAELIMLEQQGCVWCARWHSEIGPVYPKTEEGKKAPLRQVDIHKPLPDDLASIPIERFTPTFVLVENGEEIGRIRGYGGDEFFWFLLGELLGKIDAKEG